jgi:outer membrane protein assembly factor BamB
MDISDLVFTAFNKRVAALDRDTGEIVWQWKAPSGETYASLLLDGDRLIVCIHGYMYALNAANGRLLWANDMKGFGFGVASLASVRGSLSSGALLLNSAAESAAR